MLMLGCETQLKLKGREPERFSEVRWDENSCERDDDQPRPEVAEGVIYSWDVEKR